MRFRFRSELWLHAGDSGWHFVTLPPEVADEIDERVEGRTRGFGSVRVRVTMGSTSWATSLFPDTASESFVLPVKKPVRLAEGLEAGDAVEVTLDLVDED